MAERYTAHEIIALVGDTESWTSWDVAPDLTGFDDEYRASLTRAAERSGVDESVVTGTFTIHGQRVAAVVNEFTFLAGSIGRESARRIVSAVERATSEGLPLVASAASGGTRMQEGSPAFVYMGDIARAVRRHRSAGLPYLTHLRHPTTGGVFASWGSLGQVKVAQPEALVGFLGPKVFELVEGRPFPPEVQTGENLATQGVIDAVVPADHLREHLHQILSILTGGPTPSTRGTTAPPSVEPSDVWESIQRTRDPQRPGVRDLLAHGADAAVVLHGTGEGERDDAVLLAAARIDGRPCVIIAQDRSRQSGSLTDALGPGALRTARRGIALAHEWGLPIVSIVDTPGAELSPAAENGAMAGEIARTLADLTGSTVPSVAVLLGQGCGGGALAMLPAARVIATEHSWLTPLPPEGASAIVHGDIDHAPDMARSQHISAFDLQRHGRVHAIVAEPEGVTAAELCRAIAAQVRQAIDEQRD